MRIPATRQGLRQWAQIPQWVAVALIAACSAGSGEGLDISGRPLGEGGDVPLAATLESIQANVFNPFCIVCHSGAGAPQGLRLDANNSFSSLVGVSSEEDGSVLRVEPGNPDQSYLVQKLEGTAAVGGRMPLDAPALPQSTIAVIRQWIADGALPTAPPIGTPPRVVSMSPAADSTVDTLPTQVTIGFDQDVDASTLNAMTVRLQRSGGDGSFGEGNEVLIAATGVMLSPMNARLAIVDLSAVASVDDDYELAVLGSGLSVVLNLDAQALDGEFGSTFPSGDGDEGGDFVARFAVRSLQPTLASIQQAVFTPICSVCHTGPAGSGLPAGMDLTSAAASFDNLVGVASVQQPGLSRVAPGDPDNSYLVQKIEGTAAAGERMPLGGPFLDAGTIAAVREWIANGANP